MTPVEEIEQYLERERELVMAGDFQALESLQSQKEDAFARAHGLTKETLLGLQEKVQRNNALLSAAASGIRSAADQIAMIRKGGEAGATYSADGSRNHLNPRKGLQERF